MTTPNTNTAVATQQPNAPTKQDREMEFIPFGSDQAIRLSIKIVQDLICIPTKSGKFCTEKEAMKFMMLCKARALNPFEGDAFLQGYDGREGPQFSLITAHQAFLKRAEPHPEFAGMRSGVVVAEPIPCVVCKGAGELVNKKPCRRCNENGVSDEILGDIVPQGAKLIGGWATVFFRNRPEPMHKRLSLAVFNKGFGRWDVDAAGMIVKCAEADALRSSFPTKLGGLFLKEEIESIETPRNEPSRGMFGAQPGPMEISDTPGNGSATETAEAPPKRERRAKSEPSSPPIVSGGEGRGGEQASQSASGTAAAPTPPPTQTAEENPLRNAKTDLAEWMSARDFSWGQMKPHVERLCGSWAETITRFEEIRPQQAGSINLVRGQVESAIVGS